MSIDKLIKNSNPPGMYVQAPVYQYIPSVISGIILNVISVDTNEKRILYLPNIILKTKDVPKMTQQIKIKDANL